MCIGLGHTRQKVGSGQMPSRDRISKRVGINISLLPETLALFLREWPRYVLTVKCPLSAML